MRLFGQILLVVLFIALLAVLGWFDHWTWRLQHPTGPGWTYFFK